MVVAPLTGGGGGGAGEKGGEEGAGDPVWAACAALAASSGEISDAEADRLANPIAAVARVGGGEGCSKNHTPVLLQLGLKDRRVPPSQGLEWWHAVRGLQPTLPSDAHAKLLIYPDDTHALDAPATEADAWVHVAQWLATHTD